MQVREWGCICVCDITDYHISLADPEVSRPARIHCPNRTLGSDCREGYRNLRAVEDFTKTKLLTLAT